MNKHSLIIQILLHVAINKAKKLDFHLSNVNKEINRGLIILDNQ